MLSLSATQSQFHLFLITDIIAEMPSGGGFIASKSMYKKHLMVPTYYWIKYRVSSLVMIRLLNHLAQSISCCKMSYKKPLRYIFKVWCLEREMQAGKLMSIWLMQDLIIKLEYIQRQVFFFVSLMILFLELLQLSLLYRLFSFAPVHCFTFDEPFKQVILSNITKFAN